MILSPRLKKISEKVIPDLKTGDVGTDHAYLPVYLFQNGITNDIIASDINRGPLQKAQETVDRYGIDEIELRLGPGLEPLELGEVDQIIIAGMGGEIISQILAKDLSKSHSIKRFILQPMSHSNVLRRFLKENGFSIVSESLVKEEGSPTHYYQILVVEPGAMRELDSFEEEYGSRNVYEWNDELTEYLNFQIHQLKQRISKMKDSSSERTIERRLEFERRLLYLEELKNESIKNSLTDRKDSSQESGRVLG